MFKKIKENEKVNRFKELWKNPKTHNIISLSFWFVFLVVVVVFLRFGSSSQSKVGVKTNLASFSNIVSYDFRYKASDLEINGQAYKNALVFYKDNSRYYYNDKLYLIGDDISVINDYDLGVLKINNKFLENLVSGITPSYNENANQYVVPLDRFINLYEVDTDADLSLAANYNVIVNVYISDSKISKVVLDLSNYYGFKTGDSINYPLTIYYYNINNVSDFTKGYKVEV